MKYFLLLIISFVAFADFEIPSSIKPRVSFWVDIFTEYGEADLVFHHRHYPQIIFNVARLSSYKSKMSDAEFRKFKAKVDKSGTAVIYKALRKLASGNNATTEVEKRIEKSLKDLKSSNKYQKIIDEELVRSQTGIKERYAEAIKKSGLYIKRMEQIFRDSGLPIELTRLPFIESSFNYEAYSSVGAAGIWQFMPSTAKKYMIVSKIVDERKDPITATRAAAKYLRHAYKVLGSWGLAVTSYNHGITGVKRKTREFGTNNISKLIEREGEQAFGFASGNFFPEFLAAVHIYENLEHYFPNVSLSEPLQFKEYQLTSSVSINTISKKIGVSKNKLLEYNLAILKPGINGLLPARFHLKVPTNIKFDTNIKEPVVEKKSKATKKPSSKSVKTVKKTVKKAPKKVTKKSVKKKNKK